MDLLTDELLRVSDDVPDVLTRVEGCFQSPEQREGAAAGHPRTSIERAAKALGAPGLPSRCTDSARPSRTEAIGQVPLMDLVSGKPVVAPRGDSILHYVSREENGHLSECRNVGDLECQWRRVLTDPAPTLRSAGTRRHRARKRRAEERFRETWEAQVEQSPAVPGRRA